MRFCFALLVATTLVASPALAKDDGFYVGAGIGDFTVGMISLAATWLFWGR